MVEFHRYSNSDYYTVKLKRSAIIVGTINFARDAKAWYFVADSTIHIYVLMLEEITNKLKKLNEDVAKCTV